MNHSLEIPAELYSELQAAAAAAGTTPIGWIAANLKRQSSPLDGPPQAAKTLADLFEGDFGVVESDGTARLSEDCGEKFTDYLEAKRKAGNL